MKTGEAAAIQGLKSELSPLAVVNSVMAAQQSLHAVLAIRDKAVAAYQDIARMGQGETLTQGVPTAGRIANGAIVERETPIVYDEPTLSLELRNPDFATAVRITDAINAYARHRFHRLVARETDSRTVELLRPSNVSSARFAAEVGALLVEPDTPARIVLDARTDQQLSFLAPDLRLSDAGRTAHRKEHHLRRRLDFRTGDLGHRQRRRSDCGSLKRPAGFLGERRDGQFAMNEADALDLARAAIWLAIVGAGPAVGAAMIVGATIALLQALTQIQEMTLSFVPKIIVVHAALYLSASFVGSQFNIFTSMIYSRIETGFHK